MKHYEEIGIWANQLRWQLEIQGYKVDNYNKSPISPASLPSSRPPKILNQGCLIELTRQPSIKKNTPIR